LLKRFFAPVWVFNLGIVFSFLRSVSTLRTARETELPLPS
jgi:hypothetical protein